MEKPIGSLIGWMSNKVKNGGGVNFAQGIPGYSPPIELIEILKKKLFDNIHQYAPGKGIKKLLSFIEEGYKNYNFKMDQVLVVNGATEGIFLTYLYLTKILNNKVSVLNFDPSYESYIELPKIYKHKVVQFSIDNSLKIDFNKLEDIIKHNGTNIIFFCSPGNPWGRVWGKKEVENLFKLVDRYGIYLIVDGVYRELYFDKSPYIPLERVKDNIFYINSFSKKFSITGWRVGYLIADIKHIKNIEKIHDYTSVSSSNIAQTAIADYMENYNMGSDYLKNLRGKLQNSYKMLEVIFKKHNFELFNTDGGYFIWTKIADWINMDGLTFADKLYNFSKVGVVPGEHFSIYGKDKIRVNIARTDKEIELGIKGLERFFNSIK